MQLQTLQNRFALVALAVLISACTTTTAHQPLTIQEQGSFMAGGTAVTAPGTFDPIRQGTYTPTPDPAGQTLPGDHAYVFYQVPANARKLPLVFWHGHGQSGKTWETTADGREGFQTIFLRRRFPVYILDEPRRGRAGKSAQASDASVPDEQMWFGIFRFGVWPDYFPGVQLPRDPEALDQFFRAGVQTGPSDARLVVPAVSALFTRIGPGILVTHSRSGQYGWRTAAANANVRAIVSYEPGGDFIFPDGEGPTISLRGGDSSRPRCRWPISWR